MNFKRESSSESSDTDADKRSHHNSLERKRRNNLKESFSQLRDVLPYFREKKNVRASRNLILEKACDFIRKTPDLQKLDQEAASLEEENRFLEMSIACLKEAIKNKDMETIKKYAHCGLPFKQRTYLLDLDTSSEDDDSSDEVLSLEDHNNSGEVLSLEDHNNSDEVLSSEDHNNSDEFFNSPDSSPVYAPARKKFRKC